MLKINTVVQRAINTVKSKNKKTTIPTQQKLSLPSWQELGYLDKNGSGDRPASYPMGTRGSFPGGKAAGP
jgi:hypothetical protein